MEAERELSRSDVLLEISWAGYYHRVRDNWGEGGLVRRREGGGREGGREKGGREKGGREKGGRRGGKGRDGEEKGGWREGGREGGRREGGRREEGEEGGGRKGGREGGRGMGAKDNVSHNIRYRNLQGPKLSQMALQFMKLIFTN